MPPPGPVIEETISLREIFGVFRRNALIILGVVGVTLGVTAFLVLSQEPQYRAAALIRLADARRAMTGGLEDAAMERMMGASNDPLLSQLEVLRGRAVLGEVVDREGLRLRVVSGDLRPSGIVGFWTTLPEEATDSVVLEFRAESVSVRLRDETAVAPYGQPVRLSAVGFTLPSRPDGVEAAVLVVGLREAAIDALSRDLRARPRDRTDAIDVEYTHSDPLLAQRVVNTAIEVFQVQNAAASQQQSRRRRIFLEGQLQGVDSVLFAMQDQLSGFRSREQVYSSRDRIAAQQEGIFGIDVRREELAADRRMYQTLLETLSRPEEARGQTLRTLVSSPGIASNAVVAQLYMQLAEYETERSALTSGALGSTVNHPDVQRLDALIQSAEEKLVDAARSHVSSLDGRIVALDELRARSAAEIQQLPATEAEEVRLVQQVETTRRMGDQLREELQRARIAEAVEAGQVEIVYRSPVPTEPVGSGRGMKLGLGLVLGLMLGSGGAFLREHLNTSLRRQDEMEEALRVPGLAVIPRIGSTKGIRRLGSGGLNGERTSTIVRSRPDELVVLTDARSSGAEAFRMLRTNLLFSGEVQTLSTLVVTSATPGEGKTLTAANLAIAYAQQGVRVALIDCDLRRPRLHKLFDVGAAPGLAELVRGDSPAADVIRATSVDNLSLIPAGILPENPAEFVGDPRMKRMIEALTSGFDLIILDTPPLMAAADAAILGAQADGVILVVRAGSTDRAIAQHAMQQLEGVGATVIGAVLNDPDAEVLRYGGYYYYGYYGVER